MNQPLKGKIALVAGATRGAGRGIARALGEAGATVYCTGRSSRGDGQMRGQGEGRDPFDLGTRPETIEETAEQVTAAGGRGIPMVADHTDPDAVAAVVARIADDEGRLDILVNDIWGGDGLIQWGTPFWEQKPAQGFDAIERVLHTHALTSRHALPLMLQGGRGLVVEITDGAFAGYRGDFYYDLAKTLPMRMAYGLAVELYTHGHHGVTAVALTPGFLRSEAVLEHFGVTEATWREGIPKDPHFAESETPLFVGRAVAALAADANVTAKAGQALTSWDLAGEYGFDDADGRRPHWSSHFAAFVDGLIEAGGEALEAQRPLLMARYWQLHGDASRQARAERLRQALGLTSPLPCGPSGQR